LALPESFLVYSVPFSSQRDLLLLLWTCTYHTFVMSKRQSNIVPTSTRDLVKPTIRSIADNASVYVVLKNVRVSLEQKIPTERESSIQSCCTIFRFQWKLGTLLLTDFIGSRNKNRPVPYGNK